MPTFFAIVSPGLEDISEHELRVWLEEIDSRGNFPIQRHRGGLEFELPYERGFALNHVLKTVSRLLVRVDDFGCRDFPKLFRKTRALPWEDWAFPQAPTPEVHASSHTSRLRMKKRIEETCAAGFQAWRKKSGIPFDESREPRPSLFVRFVDDVCGFSMDTSGAHLHRRGYRLDVPEAPLRETIAAALLLKLFAHTEPGREWDLLDPMAGSGTFLLEAAGLGSLLKRAYAYRDFGMVRSRRVLVDTSADRWKRPASLPRFRSLTGIDSSPEALRAARINADRIMAEVSPVYLEADLFALESGVEQSKVRRGSAVICNPPYGERLMVEGPLAAYYSKLVAAIEAQVEPERVGLLLPAKIEARRLVWPQAWRPVSTTHFSNGGIPVIFHVYERAGG